MKARYIAKAFGTPEPRKAQQWGVYDTERGSWPVLIAGLGRVAHPVLTEAEAQAEANRVSEYFGAPPPY